MALGNDIINAVRTVGDAATFGLGSAMYGVYNMINTLMTRPIGLANPYGNNRALMHAMLSFNIGDYSQSNYNKYGTPIGQLANPYYNEYHTPVFKLDQTRAQYYDYLDYMDNIFFDGSKDIANKTENGIRLTSPSDLNLDNAKVGTISSLPQVTFPNLISNSNITISYINPNRYGNGNDTRMGVISNYYLSNAIQASINNQNALGYSATIPSGDTMEAGAEVYDDTTTGYKILSDAVITRGIYKNFGLTGKYGLINGEPFINDEYDKRFGSFAKPNSEVTGQIIPWSTTDNYYDSLLIHRDIARVNDLQDSVTGGDESVIKEYFTDLVQDTDLMHEYAGFGNYYSLTYSLGLVGASGAMTQNYMAYSMLGYPLSQVKIDAGNEIGDQDDTTLTITELLTNENVSGKVRTETVDKNGNSITVWEPYPRKYYVTNGSQGTNYLDQMTGCVHDFEKFGGNRNKNIVRIKIIDPGNDNMWTSKAIFEHIEAEGNVPGSPLIANQKDNETANTGISFGRYKVYDPNVIGTRPDIIYKTNKLFSVNKIKSIIGRFHTDQISDSPTESRSKTDYISTAISKYGMSRGRNLLRKDHGSDTNKSHGNNYDNPYCRVWTYHKQYHSLADTIRPFDGMGSLKGTEISRYRTPEIEGSGWKDGQTRLEELGARNLSNKLVNITPVRDGGDVKAQMKRMMFSIENLAWKGFADELTEEQQGPLGGRIMWFPPYNLTFNESVSVNWEKTNFIGRGEPIPTYVNSERTGSISFDLLIDHPSLINSFSGLGVGGEGIGDVDDTESYEQMLLRFFAGCEILDPTTPTVVQAQAPPVPEPPTPERPEAVIPVVSSSEKCVLSFFVYYPNNYSGINDLDNVENVILSTGGKSNQIIYPLLYLIRGNGSGTGLGTIDGNNYSTNKDKQVTHNINLSTDIVDGGYGYEMTEDFGLSGDNTIKYPADYNAKSPGNFRAYRSKQREWAYRVDKEWEEQILNKLNYVDNTSYCLNNAKGYKQTADGYSLPADVDEGTFVSFLDAFLGIEMDGDTKGLNILDINEGVHYTQQNIEIVKKALEILETAKEKKVVVSGFASNHGYTGANAKLSNNRKKMIETWLKQKKVFDGATYELGSALSAPTTSSGSVNDKYAKLGRAAFVAIYCTIEEVEVPPEVVEVDIPQSNINVADNVTEAELQEIKANTTLADEEEVYVGAQLDRSDPLDPTTGLLDKGASVKDVARTTVIEDLKRKDDQAKEEAGIVDKGTYSQQRNKDANQNGYKDEYKFFESLKRDDPFLHSKIVDKIRFFDPALHSLTPEGFQARLTFLQQCTHQGNTMSNSDGHGLIKSAENLAFGRPPILVLRIGDFYNTRIIINSLNIDFKNSSGVQWDLNDEGIGIMPMYATIQMGITFLGGSDLGGPIQRLQNAMSFNYYANTSVYDNRAEMIEYNEDGSGNYTKFKPYRIK